MHPEHHIPRPPWLARTLAICVGLLLLGWLIFRWDAFIADQNGLIRFALSTLFAAMLVGRTKPDKQATGIPWWGATALVGLGSFAAILGLVLPILQLEWIGLECVAAGMLCWGLPRHAHKDVWRAAFILYWAVPLPDAIFMGLQELMQKLSVQGAETLLQMFNVRAWAHDTAIYTPSATYQVPGWCSGMRAATTVLLLTLGLGMLRRLRIRYCIAFAVAAEIQVLLLNILRIGLMVVLVPAFRSERAIKFLHDTTGLLVLAAVLIVAAELTLLSRWRRRQLHADRELDEHRMRHVTEHPPFWRELGHKRPILIILMVAITATALIVNRAQRYHRAQMLKDVATGQRDRGNLNVAMAAATEVLRITPDDLSWRFTAIRLKLLHGDHQEVINELDALPPEEGRDSMQARILRAYALMSLGDVPAAAKLVESLPEETKRSDPRAAMVLAEIAMRTSKPDQTATYVLTASRWAPNTGRIRNLYPYLRVHRKWEALIEADTGQTYTNPIHAYSLLEALMNLNQTTRVAQRTRQFLEQWPEDPRLLEPIFFLALQDPASIWRKRFATHLRLCLPHITKPERLYELTYKCLELYRPDLAWATINHLREVAPDSPALPMAAAVYGNRWFRYDRRHLELPFLPHMQWRDITDLVQLTQMLPAWQPVRDALPFVKELTTTDDPLSVRKQYLGDAIEAFRQRTGDTNAPLSLDMQYLYVYALERDGQLDGAEQQLKRIAAAFPSEEPGTRALLSSIYERAGKWVDAYETLHDYIEAPHGLSGGVDSDTLAQSWTPFLSEGTIHREHHLAPLVRLGRSELKLHLGVAAMHTASLTAQRFPYAPQAHALLGRALLDYSSTATALNAISAPHFHSYQELDFLEAEALYQTQRYTELQDFASKRALPFVRIPAGAPQDTSLPPAELVLLWHHFNTPSEAEYAQHADAIRTNITNKTSPWLNDMMTLWTEAYHSHCAPHTADPDRWIATGRTPAERATSLNQLSLLLCRERRIPEARAAAQRATEALPSSPTLWLIAISLADNPTQTIAQARAHCPNDPDLWLAELVARTQADDHTADTTPISDEMAAWITQTVEEAITSHLPVETLTRAADYLLRREMPEQAARLMRHAEPRARGLLPAYILSIRCALHLQDATWATKATEQAIFASHHPLPELFKQLISLKSAQGDLSADAATIHALLSLKRLEPDTTLWPQMLGYLRFQHGGWDIVDALSSMATALDNGATNRLPFVVAAEAARLLHDVDKSLDLLREALKHHPNDPVLVNNLAYTLAHDRDHVAEATSLLPILSPLANERDDILDTMAYILLRAERNDDAFKLASELTSRTDPGSRYWVRGSRYMAEATWQNGDRERASRILTNLIEGQKSMTEEDLRETTELLARITDESERPPSEKPPPEFIPLPLR